jgi:hypothetical protein
VVIDVDGSVRVKGKRGDAFQIRRQRSDVGTKIVGQARAKPSDQLTQPEQVNTVPTSFVLPIVQRHGGASRQALSQAAATFA